MSYLFSKLLALFFYDPSSFYERVISQIQFNPHLTRRNNYTFSVVMPDGGVVNLWIANEYYGFKLYPSKTPIPIIYKAKLYDAVRNTAQYAK